MSNAFETALSFCEVSSSWVLTRSWAGNDLGSLIDLALGQTLAGRYVLVSELGSGGMGRVYLARDPVLGRDVALKVSLATTPSSLLGAPNLVEEGQLAALVNHPAIASVYDSGTHNGKPFTIFEYVDGSNLRAVIRQRPPQWPVEDVASVLRTLAEALDYAHARGVIHSDLKPENICLQQVLVGENAPWHPFDPIILQIELALQAVADLEMRALVQEMLAEAKVAKLSANPRSLRAEMDSSKKWRDLVRGSTGGEFDDVVLWFDELMNP